MAARRVTQASINWAAFLERAPPQQSAQALAFKAKVDGFARKMTALPEKPPAIDWAFYKSRVAIPGLVDGFQKKYEALSIPYPTENVLSKIEQEEKERLAKVANFVREVEGDINKMSAELNHIRSSIPLRDMTMEDFVEAYPELNIDCWDRPSHWPHDTDDLAEAEEYKRTGKIPAHCDFDHSH